MIKNSYFVWLLAVVIIVSSLACRDEDENAAPFELVAGKWQAQLATPGGPLGFGLELQQDEDGQWKAFIINEPERIEIPRVHRDGQGLTFDVDHYDSKLSAEISQEGRRIEGTWSKRRGPNRWAKLEFVAKAGASRRFARSESRAQIPFDFSGRWRVRFASDDEDSIGVFKHEGDDRFTGTFLTTTGDYRFLAGRRDGKRLRLSCFDGAHAFLFDCRADSAGQLSGDFWNWDTWHDTWTAKRDPNAVLPDGFAQTEWNGTKTLETLEFPDLDGNKKKLAEVLEGSEASIIQIFGSWCPNCHDATRFLSVLEKEYQQQGLKVMGLAFELGSDFERDCAQVRRYVKHHQVSWPILLGGPANKKAATKAFGGLDFIRSYPTWIFLNERGEVKAVYSGFSGPATGLAHIQLTRRLRAQVEDILQVR